jgi:signal transduction histidine kinase/ActR/RegA family two-component response regulator
MDERVLVWAAGRDGRLTCGFLREQGFGCVDCDAWEAFRGMLDEGAGAVVIAGEFLSDAVLPNLQAVIDTQPAWSDLPMIIVAGEELIPEDHVAALGNVSVLQRPVALDTLRSTVRAALRARRRQYEIRDLLRQRDEADHRKDEFLAMLAHELRNPLAPLRTGLGLLKLDPSPEAAARVQATMERQITNLTRLVDDLLDVSRLTRRKVSLRKVPLDVRQAVADAATAAQPLAAERDLRLELQLPNEPVMVEADPVRLEQMIGNLVGNAIKFTPQGGAIRLSVNVEPELVLIRVRDTGVGIPPEQLERVFDLFEQAEQSIDRSRGGLGIGLTVVRLLAELHGGDARIFSAGEGAGTEAIVRLPIFRRVAAMPTLTPASAPGRGPAKRVLVIEDNPDVADMLVAYLKQVGHDVIHAHDGRDGLDAARKYQPNVIVCDIGLPGLDGYEVARRVRDESALTSCVLIAVTGYGDAGDRERARSAGFTYHITKPADPVRLAELIVAGGAEQPT